MDSLLLIPGTKEDDILSGTDGTDILLGMNGDDVLNGGGGDDALTGGNGEDSLFGGDGSDLLSGGNGADLLDGGDGDDTLLAGNGDDVLDGGAGSDMLLAGKGDDTLIYTLSENTGSADWYDGGKGFDTLQLMLTSAEQLLIQDELDEFEDFLASGGQYFQFQSFNLTVSGIEALKVVTVDGGNTAPVAMDDTITETAIDGRIRVAVLGVENSSTHIAAAGQLDFTKFNAEAINYTPGADWTNILTGFEVVVLGDGGNSLDYVNETATGLFDVLSRFVDTGGGVVTTGWFARALSNINASLTLHNDVKIDADHITPITPAGHNYASTRALGADTITVLDSTHPIAGGLTSFQSSSLFGWELADMLDAGATRLATGIATDPDQGGQLGATLPAIAYDTEVGRDDVAGLPGGNTVYLGGMYLAAADFSPGLTRVGPNALVLDGLFERAIAWAAGARSGSAAVTVTIDDMDLLNNDTDVDPGDVLVIDSDSFPTTSANGAAISFDANGDIVYTIGTQELVQKLLDAPVDSFEYTVNDGNGGTDVATVNLTINGLDNIFG